MSDRPEPQTSGSPVGAGRGRPRDELQLAGWRVVVTRQAERAGELETLLRAEGATPVLVPVLTTAAPTDGGAALASALAEGTAGDWLLLTSAAAVAAVAPRLVLHGWPGPVAVVGPATAEAARQAGLRVALAMDASTATVVAVTERLVAEHPPGRVLAPASDIARAEGADVLRGAGWRFDAVCAYRTVPLAPGPATLAKARTAHAITFLSPSAVDAWADTGAPTPPVVVTIGPTTSRQATRRGMGVTVEAARRSAAGVVDALVRARAGPATRSTGAAT